MTCLNLPVSVEVVSNPLLQYDLDSLLFSLRCEWKTDYISLNKKSMKKNIGVV